MALDLLYARIPIELHEQELDRICTSYKQELCKQLQDLASQVSESDLLSQHEVDAVKDKLLSLEDFVSPTQIDIRRKGNKRSEMKEKYESIRLANPELIKLTKSILEAETVESEDDAESSITGVTTKEDGDNQQHQKEKNNGDDDGTPSRNSPVKFVSSLPQDVTSLLVPGNDSLTRRSRSPSVTKPNLSSTTTTKLSPELTASQQQHLLSASSSAASPKANSGGGEPLQRRISFIGEEKEDEDSNKNRRNLSSPFAASPGGTSTYNTHLASMKKNDETEGNNNNNNNDSPANNRQLSSSSHDLHQLQSGRSSLVNSGTLLSRTMSVTFGEVVEEGVDLIDSSNNNNNKSHPGGSSSSAFTSSKFVPPSLLKASTGGSSNDSSPTTSRKPSFAQLAKKASGLSRGNSRRGSTIGSNNNSRRGSTVFGSHNNNFNHQNPLFVPEVSAVRTDWVQNLEEAYLRTVSHREELIEALRVVSKHASGPNTMKCVASTMWPETRKAVNTAILSHASEAGGGDLSSTVSSNNLLPTAVRTIFASDGGIAPHVDDSTIQVASLPLLPHTSATWDELSSDANPKAPKDPLTWDMPTQKDVDEYFSVMNKSTKPANPFTPQIEIMKYELSLFNHVQKNKKPPSMGRDRILKSTVIAKRMLQDSITKLERLEALYDKEINDFLNVCRALQKLFIREKRDADAAVHTYEHRQKSLENLAILRAATIVDDEEFAVAGGRRRESPDVTIGDAEMRNGTMVVDVGIRCKTGQNTLLEELDKMILDTGLRHNRIKRFVDYVEDFVDRIEKFDDEVDATLKCPICRDMSTELVSFWPCGHVYCINCVPEAEESDEGEAYGAFCTVCGTNSRESFVPNFNASCVSARVRFRHAGCSELRSDAAKLRAIVLGSTSFNAILDNK